jgi:hypothetical protein
MSKMKNEDGRGILPQSVQAGTKKMALSCSPAFAMRARLRFRAKRKKLGPETWAILDQLNSMNQKAEPTSDPVPFQIAETSSCSFAPRYRQQEKLSS